jgi:peptidoglycan/xylan/chitin deacetylase (PgdA/CDA1 family)
MNGCATIVMYHYVRELSETRFPGIRGLTTSRFRAQIAYLRRFYRFVTVDDVISACHGGSELPPKSALLTFDDGYSDHYLNVFPILDAEGIQGVFFPPVCAVRDGKVLDVNKIHFVLASVPSPVALLGEVYAELDRLRADGHAIAPNAELYARLAVRGEFDPPEIIFIKRLLQRELSQALRAELVDSLFRCHVTEDERTFARELYMSEDQLRTMRRHGMAIGSHGAEHFWMNTLPPEEQREEIERSLGFLGDLGVECDRWTMCYPYGAHDASLRSICAELGCRAAFTTEIGLALLAPGHALTLARLDTNHLPQEADAPANAWTLRMRAEMPEPIGSTR